MQEIGVSDLKPYRVDQTKCPALALDISVRLAAAPNIRCVHNHKTNIK